MFQCSLTLFVVLVATIFAASTARATHSGAADEAKPHPTQAAADSGMLSWLTCPPRDHFIMKTGEYVSLYLVNSDARSGIFDVSPACHRPLDHEVPLKADAGTTSVSGTLRDLLQKENPKHLFLFVQGHGTDCKLKQKNSVSTSWIAHRDVFDTILDELDARPDPHRKVTMILHSCESRSAEKVLEQSLTSRNKNARAFREFELMTTDPREVQYQSLMQTLETIREIRRLESPEKSWHLDLAADGPLLLGLGGENSFSIATFPPRPPAPPLKLEEYLRYLDHPEVSLKSKSVFLGSLITHSVTRPELGETLEKLKARKSLLLELDRYRQTHGITDGGRRTPMQQTLTEQLNWGVFNFKDFFVRFPEAISTFESELSPEGLASPQSQHIFEEIVDAVKEVKMDTQTYVQLSRAVTNLANARPDDKAVEKWTADLQHRLFDNLRFLQAPHFLEISIELVSEADLIFSNWDSISERMVESLRRLKTEDPARFEKLKEKIAHPKTALPYVKENFQYLILRNL